MVAYEKELVLKTTVQISSRKIYQSKNIDGVLLNHLKRTQENKCGKYGYIIPDSISIIERSHGLIKVIDNESMIQYDIKHKVKSILPKSDDEYECIVDSITKMGIISYLDYQVTEDSTIQNSPLLVIIPKDYFQDDSHIHQYKMNDKIKVKVLDSRIKYQSPQIHVVAKPI